MGVATTDAGCLPLKSTNLNTKNWKILKIKTPLSICSRGSSQIIRIALVMLISGILLSEKHRKRYQLGLWYSTKVWDIVKGTRSLILTPERYDKHPHPYPIAWWLVSNNFTLLSCGDRDELVLEQNSFRYQVKGPKSFYSQSITLCSPARTL